MWQSVYYWWTSFGFSVGFKFFKIKFGEKSKDGHLKKKMTGRTLQVDWWWTFKYSIVELRQTHGWVSGTDE